METKTEEIIKIIKDKINLVKSYRNQLFNMINIYDQEDKEFYLSELNITKNELYLLKSLLKEVKYEKK